MRVNSISNSSFQANPTGIAKNCRKVIKKMGIYGGSAVGVGFAGAISILSGVSISLGFLALLPTFYLANKFENEAKKFEAIEKPYNEIRARAKKIYG